MNIVSIEDDCFDNRYLQRRLHLDFPSATITGFRSASAFLLALRTLPPIDVIVTEEYLHFNQNNEHYPTWYSELEFLFPEVAKNMNPIKAGQRLVTCIRQKGLLTPVVIVNCDRPPINEDLVQ